MSALLNSCVKGYFCVFYSLREKVNVRYRVGHTILCIKTKWDLCFFVFLGPAILEALMVHRVTNFN